MSEQPLLGLILRLVAGFIVLVVLGYFLYSRFRAPASPSKTSSPASVAIVTSTPESSPSATPTPLPTSKPITPPTQTPKTQKRIVAQKPKSTTSLHRAAKTIVIHSNPEVILLVPDNMDYQITPNNLVEEQK